MPLRRLNRLFSKFLRGAIRLRPTSVGKRTPKTWEKQSRRKCRQSPDDGKALVYRGILQDRRVFLVTRGRRDVVTVEFRRPERRACAAPCGNSSDGLVFVRIPLL